MGKAIVISGTPGVGKTRISLRLASILNAKYINLSDFAIENKLYQYFDTERSTYVIDEDILRREISRIIKDYEGYVIIDSHYGEIVDDDLVEKIFILRLNPRDLLKRLESKGWSKEKVRENVEAEVLGICTQNALNEHPRDKVCEIDTSGKEVDEVIEEIMDVLKGVKPCRIGVDWLSSTDVGSLLEYILRRYYPNSQWRG